MEKLSLKKFEKKQIETPKQVTGGADPSNKSYLTTMFMTEDYNCDAVAQAHAQ